MINVSRFIEHAAILNPYEALFKDIAKVKHILGKPEAVYASREYDVFSILQRERSVLGVVFGCRLDAGVVHTYVACDHAYYSRANCTKGCTTQSCCKEFITSLLLICNRNI